MMTKAKLATADVRRTVGQPSVRWSLRGAFNG